VYANYVRHEVILESVNRSLFIFNIFQTLLVTNSTGNAPFVQEKNAPARQLAISN
jgi:hypothetical protein